MNTLELLNGQFTAELIKGAWQYTPTYKKIEKKVDKGNLKEKPQYAFISVAEKETVTSYNKVLKQTVLDVVRYLKTI